MNIYSEEINMINYYENVNSKKVLDEKTHFFCIIILIQFNNCHYTL